MRLLVRLAPLLALHAACSVYDESMLEASSSLGGSDGSGSTSSGGKSSGGSGGGLSSGGDTTGGTTDVPPAPEAASTIERSPMVYHSVSFRR